MPILPALDDLQSLLEGLRSAGTGERTEAERIDRITLLEQVKAAACAAQAREAAALKRDRLAAEEARGVPTRDRGRGLGAEVALARRESPHRGSRLLGLAEALVHELPHTLEALTAGEINEWRATLVARATACLSREDRVAVDAELAGRLGRYGDRQVEAEARRIAYRLDPQAAVTAASRAAADRRVSLRPAPDTMAILSGLLPVAQGVATYAALTRDADALRAAGDERTRGQLMADLLVERVTGQATADRVPVEVQLVMTDRTLLAGDDEPARLAGHGPVPAGIARALVTDTEAAVFLRRILTDGVRLTGRESTRRDFPTGLREQIVLRDGICRTPWCDAPVRQVDHVLRAAESGPTAEANAQGLCEACNLAKEADGWRSRPVGDDAGRSVEFTTPTGQRYRSHPPWLPGTSPPPLRTDVGWVSEVERFLVDFTAGRVGLDGLDQRE